MNDDRDSIADFEEVQTDAPRLQSPRSITGLFEALPAPVRRDSNLLATCQQLAPEWT